MNIYLNTLDGRIMGTGMGDTCVSEDGSIRVKLFSDPTQIFLVNVVLEKASDLEAR